MSYATVGVVGAVAIEMRRLAVKTRVEIAIAGLAVAALSFRVANLLEVVAVAGLVGVFLLRPPEAPQVALSDRDPRVDTFPPASTRLRSVVLPPMLLLASGSLGLFAVFAHIGVATFGGGFAMIPPIEHEVVALRGWLTEAAFHDAMVLGQVTPGPVAIAATFIGYRVGGLAGSIAATLGMFGPPFALSLLAARSVTAFRSNTLVRGFLLGVSPAVVGVIAAAAVSLWRTSVDSPFAAVVAVTTWVALARFPKLSPLIPLVLGGAVNALGGT
jgi:chromate transporter